MGNAATNAAAVKLEMLVSPSIDVCRALRRGEAYFRFLVIAPKCAIAPTDRTIAAVHINGRRFHHKFNGTAVTGPLDHRKTSLTPDLSKKAGGLERTALCPRADGRRSQGRLAEVVLHGRSLPSVAPTAVFRSEICLRARNARVALLSRLPRAPAAGFAYPSRAY